MIATVLISQWTKLKLLQQPFNDFLVSCLWEKKYINVLIYLWIYRCILVLFIYYTIVIYSLFVYCDGQCFELREREIIFIFISVHSNVHYL